MLMKQKRRDFLKYAGLTGIAIAGGSNELSAVTNPNLKTDIMPDTSHDFAALQDLTNEDHSLIGSYVKWASSLIAEKLPSLSFRRKEFADIDKWRDVAKAKLNERLGIPDIGGLPQVKLQRQYPDDRRDQVP